MKRFSSWLRKSISTVFIIGLIIIVLIIIGCCSDTYTQPEGKPGTSWMTESGMLRSDPASVDSNPFLLDGKDDDWTNDWTQGSSGNFFPGLGGVTSPADNDTIPVDTNTRMGRIELLFPTNTVRTKGVEPIPLFLYYLKYASFI